MTEEKNPFPKTKGAMMRDRAKAIDDAKVMALYAQDLQRRLVGIHEATVSVSRMMGRRPFLGPLGTFLVHKHIRKVLLTTLPVYTYKQEADKITTTT